MTAPSPIGPATSTWLMPAVEATTRPADVVVDQVDEHAPRIGRLQRWQLTEPVRLWIFTVLLVATAALQLAGYATDEWVEFAGVNGALVLGVGAAGEGIRASVYSPAGVIRAARAAAGAVR